jgi:hypothetical protein
VCGSVWAQEVGLKRMGIPTSVICVHVQAGKLPNIRLMAIGKLIFFFRFEFIYHLKTLTYLSLIPFRCQRCLDKGREKCYHWLVGDEASIEVFRETLHLLLDDYLVRCGGSSFNDIRVASTIKYNPTD